MSSELHSACFHILIPQSCPFYCTYYTVTWEFLQIGGEPATQALPLQISPTNGLRVVARWGGGVELLFRRVRGRSFFTKYPAFSETLY